MDRVQMRGSESGADGGLHRSKNNPVRFVSFSGIDGAGKSTQIEALRLRLEQMGLRVRVVAFWDEVARLTSIRDGAGHAIFGGETGIGTPAKPVHRRDKNIQSWPISGLRLGLYLLDALSVRSVVARLLSSDLDVVVFDRYIWDELANLSLRHPLVRAYARMTIALVPKPEISYLLDADPVEAQTRKPEYPLDFLYTNRQSYFDLKALFEGMTLIAPMPIEDAKREVLRHAIRGLSLDRGRPAEPDGFCAEPADIKTAHSHPAPGPVPTTSR
jgi:thymidylate kinase